MSDLYSKGDQYRGMSGIPNGDDKLWDTSALTSMRSMFAQCAYLRNLDLSHFDTSNVTDMTDMFNYCNHVSTIKGVIDMKSCTKYENMFFAAMQVALKSKIHQPILNLKHGLNLLNTR